MTFETVKWIYQRISTILIFVLFVWLLYNINKINTYNYESIYFFFNNSKNLFFFIILIVLSLFHSSIEVFHSIHDYFHDTKNQNKITNLTKILYVIIFLSIMIFIFKFQF